MSTGQLQQNIAPITDVGRAHRAVGILARAAQDGRRKQVALVLVQKRVSISVSMGQEPVIISPRQRRLSKWLPNSMSFC